MRAISKALAAAGLFVIASSVSADDPFASFIPDDGSCDSVMPALRAALAKQFSVEGAKAAPEFERLVKAAPYCSTAHMGLGESLYRRGAWSLALAQFDAAFNTGFPDPIIHLGRGLSSFHLNHVDEAIAELSLVEKRYPENVELLMGLAWAYNQRHQFAAAIAYGRKAQALAPDNPGVLHTLGIALEEQGQHADAIEVYDHAVSITPNDAELHYNRGVALMRNREFDRSIADFSAAVNFDPDMADGYVLRGESNCRRGDAQAAKPDYEQALRVDPDHDDAKWLLEHLDLCRPELIHALESRP